MQRLLEDRGLFDDGGGRGLTFKQGVLIFIRSRMRCKDDGLTSASKTLSKHALRVGGTRHT